ncbi:MAG: YbaB/EbfC family nucleoid-associated protein [Cypionkella sp.]|jgi:DNA-binding YbaB/EbfC family protein
MLKGLGGLGDMAKMIKAAQQMQGRMAQLQETLARTIITGDAGGGLVTVRCTGKGDVIGVDLSPSILHASAQMQAQELILAAIQDAQSRARVHMAAEMARLTQEMGLPPDMALPS